MTVFRSIDGSGNNGARNAVGADFLRLGGAADGTMLDGPNPRAISNIVVGEGDPTGENPQGLSGFMYAWGQFLDHDTDLSPSDGVNHIDIAIPTGDPNFPDGSTISMTRALTGAGGQPINTVTGWVDGSMVYGSNAAVAMSLRGSGGYLLTSDGDNLPIVNGFFMAGDVRAAENPSLTALQTIFVREHNYQVDLLAATHMDWTSDQLYQEARAIVGAEIAHITYGEFLPHLLGSDAIDPYTGFDVRVDPSISIEFAGAAFRFGHSIVSDEAERVGNWGEETGEELTLAESFFLTPEGFADGGGADGFLRHLGSEGSQAMDARIVDGLRNFLVDTPAGVAMDLAAINIQRGRDLGLGTLNETRLAIGLLPYASFEEITDDLATVAALREAFGSVDAVDLWTGGLSERTTPGAMVGETFGAIIGDQFTALRDGDPLWYQRAGFDPATLSRIESTSLSDIIERTTDTGYIQDDVFDIYIRRSGILGGVEAENPDAKQLVIGSYGTDALIGGSFDDILVPSLGGLQVLMGMEGADEFVFNENGIDATITDFTTQQDLIVFDVGAASLGEVNLQFAGGDTVLDFWGTHIVIEGALLGSGDIMFA